MILWDADYVKRKIKLYRELYRGNPSKKNKISSIIFAYKDVLDYLFPPSFDSEISDISDNSSELDKEYIAGINRDFYFVNAFGPYLAICNDFFDKFINIELPRTDDLPKINIENGDLIVKAKQFYSSVSKYFQKELDSLEEKGKLKLLFRNSESEEDYGQTFHIPILHEKLVIIEKNNNFQDYVTYIHEMGHVLAGTINPGEKQDTNKYMLWEIVPLFFEQLALDYFSKTHPKECNDIRLDSFNDMVFKSCICNLRKYIVDNKEDINDVNDIMSILNKDFILSGIQEEEILGKNLCGTANYLFAYVIAIELYMLYRVNKKEALSKLWHIMKLQNLDSIDYLLELYDMGIYPLANMGKYVDIINRKSDSYGKEL